MKSLDCHHVTSVGSLKQAFSFVQVRGLLQYLCYAVAAACAGNAFQVAGVAVLAASIQERTVVAEVRVHAVAAGFRILHEIVSVEV